jgi:hypothetical protein
MDTGNGKSRARARLQIEVRLEDEAVIEIECVKMEKKGKRMRTGNKLLAKISLQRNTGTRALFFSFGKPFVR